MVSGSRTAQKRCAKCGSPMADGDVLCINCGFHAKARMGAKNVMRAKSAGRAGVALGVSAAVAFVCAAAWAGLAVFAHVEIGIVAWGIGFVTGLPVLLMTDERSTRTGLAAAGIALGALLLAKLMIVQWGVIPQAAEEIAGDEEALMMPVMIQMAANGELSAEHQAILDADDATEEQVEQVMSAVRTRIGEMSNVEKREAAKQLAGMIVGEMSIIDKIGMQCSPYDLLWFALAVGSAFKLGSGAMDEA